MQQLLQIEINFEDNVLLENEWKKDLPLFISTALALIILGASSGAVAISLMGLGALRAWLAGQNIDELERIKFAQALADTLKNKRAELIKLIRTHLEASCRDMRTEIDREMNELIQDTQKQLDQAIELREKQEQDIQTIQEQTEEAEHQIQRLYASLSELIEDV